jgi:3-methyladenine DNA glycosylase AlkC
MHRHLPTDYETAINILKPVAENFSGFEYMFFQDYVECFGLADFETSISALEHFTQYASSEFAVRAFILQDEKRMMKQMNVWARSENHHVRRLASEGCRPRLPWAIALPTFKNDPRPILPILKTLMNDESEYVRRSVANNLNDISKDNPDIVLDWANQWLDGKPGKEPSKQTRKLIKHACRTLLRQGDQRTLALFGYAEAEHIKIDKLKVQQKVKIGEELTFSFLLKTDGEKLGKCRIEFAIDFVRANDKLNRKVFKISEADYDQKEKRITKRFSFKKISTRKYYAGQHHLTIVINGIDQIPTSFQLILK